MRRVRSQIHVRAWSNGARGAAPGAHRVGVGAALSDQDGAARCDVRRRVCHRRHSGQVPALKLDGTQPTTPRGPQLEADKLVSDLVQRGPISLSRSADCTGNQVGQLDQPLFRTLGERHLIQSADREPGVLGPKTRFEFCLEHVGRILIDHEVCLPRESQQFADQRLHRVPVEGFCVRERGADKCRLGEAGGRPLIVNEGQLAKNLSMLGR